MSVCSGRLQQVHDFEACGSLMDFRGVAKVKRLNSARFNYGSKS